MIKSILVACLFGVSSLTQAQQNGKFIGEVVAKWSADGRTMTLAEDFAYLDADNLQWYAPKGSVVDGASIPQVAWSVIGGPFEGRYRYASVIHDVACEQRTREAQAVHRAFYGAMLAAGVSETTAKVMYGAVYHFGPHWNVKEERYKRARASLPVLEAELQREAVRVLHLQRDGADTGVPGDDLKGYTLEEAIKSENTLKDALRITRATIKEFQEEVAREQNPNIPRRARVVRPPPVFARLKDKIEKAAADGRPLTLHQIESIQGESRSDPFNVFKLK
ncbi:DUF1353 domain-containing protein [Massilia sp. DJPM01]|uniref:DUF1353 domain-containing protein n=1 Tax=Massilia sp. DJPM01 TaxID=3024404 RepID=UPI00259D9937|nr:DUF1353 domain-containing protein [Massilia sp. DJPM01]MDM5179012.1 DUF1353 domain-containing protein [Massilia sp. DJPM01]